MTGFALRKIQKLSCTNCIQYLKQEIFTNHKEDLINIIIRGYIKIRFLYIVKNTTKINKTNEEKNESKINHFKI